MKRTPAPYVVIGGTGILAPLGARLAHPEARRIAVSRCRSPRRGDWDEFVCCDTTDASSVTALLAGLGESAYHLVGYLPALTPMTWERLCGNALRRVLLAPSAYADPSRPDALTAWTAPGEVSTCLLGWTPTSPPRWHSSEEISAAARRALDAPPGVRAILGTVHPWTSRPA